MELNHRPVTRTQLVLNLPPPEGIRVVIVADEEVVNFCLGMVVARFGALVISGPASVVSGMIDEATPHAHVSQIAADEGEASAIVQKPHEPSGKYTVTPLTIALARDLDPGRADRSNEVSCEIFLSNPIAAVALALSATGIDPTSS